MAPQPQSSSQSLSSSINSANSSAHDPLSLLVKASTSLEEDGQSSLPPQPTRRSPLHQMAVNQQAQGGLSPLQQMSSRTAASNSVPVGQQQQLDSSILSRMVTAGGTGRGASNIRVASMQEFRHASHASMNSLNAVPEKSRLQMRAPNQMFSNIGGQQTVTSSMCSSSSSSNPIRGTPDNPLLKMMEERMAAKKASTTDETPPVTAATTTKTTSPAMANMTTEQKSALNASINKWAGIGTHVASRNISATLKSSSSFSQLKPVDETKTSKPSPTLAPAQSQSAARNDLLRRLSNTEGSPSRTPLDPSQEKLLQELIQSQTSTSSTDNSPATNNNTSPTSMDVQRLYQNPSPMQLVSSAQDFVAQVLLQQQQQQQQQAQMQQQMVPNLHGIRSAVSLAEIDRLRKANQSVQLRQQMAIQERLNQQFLLQRQMSNGSSPASTGLPNEFSMRKRRSSTNLEDDTVVSSRTPSVASSTSCNKIQRSDSHVSVHTSMENLRLHGSRHSGLNMRNQSFSSTSNLKNVNTRNQSFASGLNLSRHQNSMSGLNMCSVSSGLNNMRNQSFSSGSASAAQMGLRQASSKVGMNGMKRNTSSSSWIQSMISTQDTAGKAAATAHQLKTELQRNNSASEPVASIEKPVQEEEVITENISKSPIQVTAEEYPAPPLQRGTSEATASCVETVIISELPDRIKFQNVQIDKKPIDVVRDALSSRGEDATIKPTVDMPADFFVESEEMYIQEAVDAVRSNDVEALKRLAEAGSNLQCGNRFGETLIHLACRRSHTDVVTFLVKEAGVSIKVRDDYGRTPMHDACWRATVDVDLMDLLMETCPELLLLSDKRGHTPLDYARREHWEVLIPFLNERKHKFRSISLY